MEREKIKKQNKTYCCCHLWEIFEGKMVVMGADSLCETSVRGRHKGQDRIQLKKVNEKLGN